MRKAQIFMFDIAIAVTAFVVIMILVISFLKPQPSISRQSAYETCLSINEALKANNTLRDVANGTSPESLLNTSLSQLPSRFGYHLNITTYTLSGAEVSTYMGESGNLSAAEQDTNVVAIQSTVVTDNSTPLFGKVRLKCWVKS